MAVYDKTSGPVMKVLSVRLTDSDQAVLEKVSAATGKSHSEVIKEALHWLADKSGVSDMLTIDDAHFSAYRTPGGKALRNLI